MLYILENIGKGKIGLGERQISPDELILIEDSTPDLLRSKDRVLLVANWVENVGTGFFDYTYANTRIKATSDVEFIPHSASVATVNDAGIQPHTPISVGQAIITASNVPVQDITVDVLIKRIKDV
jgi:hypothetical protein